MEVNFDLYPNTWGLNKPDKNIDHRRVLNLMTYFGRKGKELPTTENIDDYNPGDIVCWDIGGGINHIGIVSKKKSEDNKRFLIIHNIGSGQVAEDCIFDFSIIGHYEFSGEETNNDTE